MGPRAGPDRRGKYELNIRTHLEKLHLIYDHSCVLGHGKNYIKKDKVHMGRERDLCKNPWNFGKR